MESQGIPEDMPIREKYSTKAAAWYRKNLRAEAEGTEAPEPLESGTGCLPANGRPDPALQLLDRVFDTPRSGDGSRPSTPKTPTTPGGTKIRKTMPRDEAPPSPKKSPPAALYGRYSGHIVPRCKDDSDEEPYSPGGTPKLKWVCNQLMAGLRSVDILQLSSKLRETRLGVTESCTDTGMQKEQRLGAIASSPCYVTA